MSELVSVIIPTYNHAHFLPKAIQSVIDQTYTNWELIIVDNHSSDNTLAIIKGFNDPRIMHILIHNEGVIAVSRNKGIEVAKGSWVAFLDSDDWWTSDKIETCFRCMNGMADFAFHDLELTGIASRKKKIIKGKIFTPPIVNDLLINGNPICNSSVMIRKAILEYAGIINEDRSMVASEDYHTWLKIALTTDKFCYVPDTLGYYMYHAGGMSKKDMSVSIRKASEAFLHMLTPRERCFFEARLAYVQGSYQLIQKEYKKAVINFYNSLKNGTLTIRKKSIYKLVTVLLSIFFTKK